MTFVVVPMSDLMSVPFMITVALVVPVTLLLCLVAVMVGRFMLMRVLVPAFPHQVRRQQFHAALRTFARLVADNVWVHRTGVGGCAGSFLSVHLHFGDEGKGLVGSCI